MVQWHKNDLGNRCYLNLPGGKKKRMPRYYKDKIYNSEERGYLKGEFEKKFREKDMEKIRLGKVQSLHDREQAVLAAYRKMDVNVKNVV